MTNASLDEPEGGPPIERPGTPALRTRSPLAVGEASTKAVEVVAAVIERDGKLLITRRREGTHLSGLWEFPGGKSRPGETPKDALRREIREELGASVRVGDPIETVEWQYPDKRVSIVFFGCTLEGEPRPLEGQEMAWVTPADLTRYEFPAADTVLIRRLVRG